MQEIQEMGVGSLRGEDPLEKKMATCSSTLAYKIPWTKEPCGLSQWSCKELDTTEHTCIYTNMFQLKLFVSL